MKREDFNYYLAYISMFILLGVWILLGALGIVGFGEAFLLWVLSIAVLMMIFGSFKTKRKPKGESALILGGMVLSIVSLVILALSFETLEIMVAIAISIICIALGGLLFFYSRVKGTIED